MNFEPERTAINRTRNNQPIMTKPLNWLLEKGYPNLLSDVNSMLDYGAGKAHDAELIHEEHPNINTQAYDPHPHKGFEHRTTFPQGWWDLVTCNFVLNVLEIESAREEVVQDIYRLTAPEGYFMLSTRSRKDISKQNYTEEIAPDVYVSKKTKTYYQVQVPYDSEDLVEFVKGLYPQVEVVPLAKKPPGHFGLVLFKKP